jgi:hypothetical protein
MLQARHAPAPTDAESEALRHAYNAAFHELDLNWHWDAATFSRLRPSGRAGLLSYLENEQGHLLRAYTADFLVDLIEGTKDRLRLSAMAPAGRSHTPLLAA